MPPTRNATSLKVLLHAIFFLSGIATILIGQILPALQRHFTLSDLQVSTFFPAQFAGSLTGTFLTSRFARRRNYLAAAAIGGISMACGLVLINVDSFVFCLLGFLVNGLGIGMTLPSINMVILELNTGRSAAALSFLNFFWGVGAIICKPFVDFFSTADSIGLTAYILATPLILTSSLLIFAAMSEKKAAVPAGDDDVAGPIWTMPIAWAIAMFNFIHVGFESGMGGWLTTYTDRFEGRNVSHWVSPTLLYFLLFVIGRLAAPFLFRFLNENKMLFLGLGLVLLGMALTLAASTEIALSLGAAVAGFGTSWIFPTNVARFSRVFGLAATRRATPLFIAGTLGAAVSTWAIGFISDRTGSLHLGMYVLVISVLLLIVLQTGLSLRHSRPRTRSSK